MPQAVATDKFDYGLADRETEKVAKAKAKSIRERKKVIGRNVFDIGLDLLDVRERFENSKGLRGEATWSHWLKTEPKLLRGTANKAMQVARKFDGDDRRHLVSYDVLVFLAADRRDPESVEEVMSEAQSKPDKMIGRRAREIIQSKLPSPTEARTIARETGSLVAASDGRTYTGKTDDEGREALRVQEQTYGGVDAIILLAKWRGETDPPRWLNEAPNHQLADLTGKHIDLAIEWLEELRECWGKDVVDGE